MFADMFSIFVLIATIILMTLLVWGFIIIYEIESFGDFANPRTVELTMFTYPVKYDSMMLSFLEYEYESIPMREILNAVAIQESKDVWIKGKWIDVSIPTEDFFDPKIDKPFILRMQAGDKEVNILWSDVIPTSETTPLNIQKTSIDLFTLNGEVAYLELLVKE